MRPYIKARSILSAKPYQMEILFSDGQSKTVDFKKIIKPNNALANQVLNKNYFMCATVSKYGAIEWPNGYDVSPLSL
ncbi:MAG: DUF2442 domain-containing protein [Bacteroidota bacterium]|nr:DUF2442 domain-containing protein [Bacteroidota bacterium]